MYRTVIVKRSGVLGFLLVFFFFKFKLAVICMNNPSSILFWQCIVKVIQENNNIQVNSNVSTTVEEKIVNTFFLRLALIRK